MARRSGLGKGLSALIPQEAITDRSAALIDVPLASVVPNPHQPRDHFDEETLSSLTASIKELGVLQPVLVRPMEDDRYELIAGERRLRAAKRAGLQSIPALVRHIDGSASLEQALVENLHRQDLNALEEAAAYQQLIEDFSFTHEVLATRVGKSRAAITNTLRLFQLPPSIQRMVQEGRLSAGHARALLGTPDRAYQESLARKAISEGLSVRAVEEAIKARGEGESGSEAKPRSARLRPPGLLELEELLSNHLETRVNVQMGAKRGKVVIDFATLEDLERIYRAMTEPQS